MWSDFDYYSNDNEPDSEDEYGRSEQSFYMAGSFNFGVAADFYIRRGLAIGLFYKRNNANFTYRHIREKSWGRTDRVINDVSLSPRENSRRDIAFYMKAFLTRSFYVKTGLGYMTMSQPYYGYYYRVDHTVSSVTLPVAIGNEWSFGAIDFSIDWLSAIIALNRLYSYSNVDEGRPLHEFSFGTLSLGFSV